MRNADVPEIRLTFHETSGDLVLELRRKVWTPAARLLFEPSADVVLNGEFQTGDRPEVELRGKNGMVSSSAPVGGRRIRRQIVNTGQEGLLQVVTTLDGEKGDRIGRMLDVWEYESPLEFAWTPILRPDPDYRIADYIFRSPALILGAEDIWLGMIPDLDMMADATTAGRLALDLNTLDDAHPRFSFGFEPTRPARHVYFELDPDKSVAAEEQGEAAFGYYLIVGIGDRPGFLRRVVGFLWERFGSPRRDAQPEMISPKQYASVAFPTVLETEWVDFEVGDKPVGGIKALAAHAGYFERPDPIVWNQVWFNAQRSAFGLGHFGKANDREEWLEAGRRITEWTLSAPSWSGLFPALYAYETGEWWGSVPRLNGGQHRIHIPNVAWTSMWLLRWHRHIRADERILARVIDAANRLAELQDTSGAVPSWVDHASGVLTPVSELQHAAPTGAAAMLFGELARTMNRTEFVAPLEKACAFLEREVLPGMRWWDFETFYSCSPKPLDFFDSYTGQTAQNTYSMFWAARSFLDARRVTGEQHWLDLAVQVVDLMSLYQQVWDAPFLSLNTHGGFGVMNTDAEWNDSRQAVFAPLYLEMYEVTGSEEYRERGLAALWASFVLGSVPENEAVSPVTYNAHPPGLMPENFAHAGIDGTHARSDSGWGEAGALSTAAWIESLIDQDHDHE